MEWGSSLLSFCKENCFLVFLEPRTQESGSPLAVLLTLGSLCSEHISHSKGGKMEPPWKHQQSQQFWEVMRKDNLRCHQRWHFKKAASVACRISLARDWVWASAATYPCQSCYNTGFFNSLCLARDWTCNSAMTQATAVGFLTHCHTEGTPNWQDFFLFVFCLFLCSFVVFWLYVWHAKVPKQGIEPLPQQRCKPLQWQSWILNSMSHQGALEADIFNPKK